ncbi:MAG TPA: SEC-C domain-containing protein [Longimicrobiaceae bacterium]
MEEQLQFLEASANSFDMGVTGEAKRLAMAIRILVHDTRNSRSLLGQLGMLGGKFVDSTHMGHPGGDVQRHPLAAIGFRGETAFYMALLDRARSVRLVGFEEWWGGLALAAPPQIRLSRRDLVLSLAEQDGGAHVDPGVNEAYALMSRDNAIGWVNELAGDVPLNGVHLCSVRQIAHELLKSINPEYSKEPQQADLIMMDWTVSRTREGPPIPINDSPLKLLLGGLVGQGRRLSPGRHTEYPELCECGSGRKQKNCHGRTGTRSGK